MFLRIPQPLSVSCCPSFRLVYNVWQNQVNNKHVFTSFMVIEKEKLLGESPFWSSIWGRGFVFLLTFTVVINNLSRAGAHRERERLTTQTQDKEPVKSGIHVAGLMYSAASEYYERYMHQKFTTLCVTRSVHKQVLLQFLPGVVGGQHKSTCRATADAWIPNRCGALPVSPAVWFNAATEDSVKLLPRRRLTPRLGSRSGAGEEFLGEEQNSPGVSPKWFIL